MKELEVKSMLSDTNIPDSYKLGGRLDERFLAGVEYAEAAMGKAPEMWVARDKGRGIVNLFKGEPQKSKPYDGVFTGRLIGSCGYSYEFPEVTFENSPKKVRLILEDEL